MQEIPIQTHIRTIAYAARLELPADATTPQDKAVIDARLDALEGRDLPDLASVDPAVAEAAAGEAFVMGQDGRWTAVPITTGTIATVDQDGAVVILTNINRLSFRGGLKVRPHESIPNYAIVEPNLEETPHTHRLYAPIRAPFGSAPDDPPLASGTRLLATREITLPVGVPTVIDVAGYLHAQGVNDRAQANLLIAIEGETSSSASLGGTEPFTWEWGVNDMYVWEHSRTITATAASPESFTVSFSVERVAGELQIISGWMTIRRQAAG